jgi:CelD/BcsL family acetyltransferase involved in cellulose biosynthesis
MFFVEVRQGDRLVAIAPLLIYPRQGERVLAFMGGGVSDYLDLLMDPEWDEAVEQILFTVLKVQEDWSMLDLTDLPAQSPLLKSSLFRNLCREHDSCSVLPLPASEDAFLHLLSKRQRANLRNAHSRLQRAGGGTIEVATAENLPDFLNDLYVLHTGRWSARGEAGVLADQKVREFHRICTPELLENGLLRLSRLRLAHRTLAVIYSLFSSDTAFCYLQGFDPEFGSLSPGTQLMYSAICDAIDHGLNRFDFLRGEEAYKQHWRPERRPTYRIQIRRGDLRVLLQQFTPTHARAA